MAFGSHNPRGAATKLTRQYPSQMRVSDKTPASIRICAAKGYQVFANYSSLKRQGPESPMNWPA
jgi:hypothetical protein